MSPPPRSPATGNPGRHRPDAPTCPATATPADPTSCRATTAPDRPATATTCQPDAPGRPVPAADLDWILDRTRPLWADLAGQDLFLTGGTGFFGRWLLESFLYANDRLDLQARVTLLSRDPARFRDRFPHLGDHRAVRWHQGEITAFAPPAGSFPFVVHGAVEASDRLNRESPLVMFDTITAGTRRVLEFAAAAGTRRFLFVSSGGVYGRQPPDLPLVGEDFAGAPDPFGPGAAYGLGKRAAEFLGAVWGRTPGRVFTAARCFAFVGPHLPLDQHFAVGQFIRAGLAGEPIVVAGDGRPGRSYLYAADLAGAACGAATTGLLALPFAGVDATAAALAFGCALGAAMTFTLDEAG